MITDKIAIHNDLYNRRITNTPELINFFLKKGWKLGLDKTKQSIKIPGKYYHRDNIAIKLYQGIDTDIPFGFIKGNIERDSAYCLKVSEGKKAKKLHMYHDTEQNVYWIAEGDSIPSSLIKGSTYKARQAASKANKGKKVWNKGIKITMSAAHRAKINEAQARFDIRQKKSRSMKKTLAENPNIILKAFETKKLNNNCNSSKPEEIFYRYLINKYGENNILRNYSKDTRYPYPCDFYVICEDKFIELNLTWCHGNHPYNPNDIADQTKLRMWEEKAKKSKYYEEAIKTWTKKDVNKLKTAQKNNLNYIVMYRTEWREFINNYDNK